MMLLCQSYLCLTDIVREAEQQVNGADKRVESPRKGMLNARGGGGASGWLASFRRGSRMDIGLGGAANNSTISPLLQLASDAEKMAESSSSSDSEVRFGGYPFSL
jgi:hypothetical protein